MTSRAVVPTTGERVLRLVVEPAVAASWEALLDEFDAEIEAAELDAGIHVVLFRVIGAHREEFPPEGHLFPWATGLALRFERSAARVRRCPKPVILSLEGPLEGSSLGLLALADVVVASPGCTLRPGVLGAALPGLIPLLGAAANPPRRALMPLLTGRELDALAARECGLLTDVVPAERIEVVIEELVRGIVESGPTAVALLKRAARGSPAAG